MYSKNIVSLKEMTLYLKVSESELRKLVRQKEIPNIRVGNRIKFDMNKIDKWLEKKEENSVKFDWDI